MRYYYEYNKYRTNYEIYDRLSACRIAICDELYYAEEIVNALNGGAS